LPVNTGRRTGVYSEIDDAVWIQSDSVSSPTRGLLTKLHGSVDWSRVGDQVYFGTPKYQGRHEDQVIIYPGFKGTPDKKPFTLFHEHFSRSVERADVAVFIGFAFRDQYINQVLRDRLRPNAAIVVVNPAETLPSVPFDAARITHIRTGLEAKTLSQVMKAIARDVATNPN
jgi:hypothetical protein